MDATAEQEARDERIYDNRISWAPPESKNYILISLLVLNVSDGRSLASNQASAVTDAGSRVGQGGGIFSNQIKSRSTKEQEKR